MDPKQVEAAGEKQKQLDQENRELRAEIKQLKQKARMAEELSEDLEELVQERVALGLDRATAIEAAKNQMKHDAAGKAAKK